MKSTVFALLLIVFELTLFGQKPDSTKVKFVKTVYDYGKIRHNSNGNFEFKFINVGDKLLAIADVYSGCDCTIPQWSKEDVNVGETSSIKGKYNTNEIGKFNKTILVYFEGYEDPIILKLIGEVIGESELNPKEKENAGHNHIDKLPSFVSMTDEIHTYLDYKSEHYDNVWGNFIDEEVFSLSEEDFIQILDSFIVALYKPLREYLSNNEGLDPVFVEFEKKRFKYHYFDLLTTYHRYSPVFTNIKQLPDSNYFQFVDSANFTDSRLLELKEYRDFIFSYTLDLAYIEGIKNSVCGVEETKRLISIINNTFPDKKIRHFVLNNIIYRQLRYLKVNDEIINTIKQAGLDSVSLVRILTEYQKMEKLTAGSEAPDAKLIDINGDTVSISDYKKKMLFIYVWDPHCPSCHHEFPYFEELQQKFKKEKIVFLSVCVSRKKESWEEYVKNNELSGNLFYAVNGWASEIRKNYQIPSTPTCILIDKKGKIISARAPKPSDSMLSDLMYKYL